MLIPATFYESETISTSAPKSAIHQQQQQHTQTPSTRKNKPQQCLRFAPTISVVEVPSHRDYSTEEIHASWFQPIDYQDFREHCYMTLGLYRAGLLVQDTDQHCLRGLEGRLQEAARDREWMRHHATAAVLNEQYQQYRRSYYSPARIAELYHAVSWKAQYTAYTKAMLDEQQAAAAVSLLLVKKTTTARRSDAKNVLRKVIDIERSTDYSTMAMAAGMDVSSSSSCSLQTTMRTGADFDINRFFQELTIAAQ